MVQSCRGYKSDAGARRLTLVLRLTLFRPNAPHFAKLETVSRNSEWRKHTMFKLLKNARLAFSQIAPVGRNFFYP